MKRIGIDFGAKRVGIALSDDMGVFAFPREIMKNDARLLDAVRVLCDKEGVGEIVIGESLDHAGIPNPIMADARIFAGEIGKATGLPVVFQKEFMTSLEARRPTDGKKKLIARKLKQDASAAVDASAAALILQRYLDTVNSD